MMSFFSSSAADEESDPPLSILASSSKEDTTAVSQQLQQQQQHDEIRFTPNTDASVDASSLTESRATQEIERIRGKTARLRQERQWNVDMQSHTSSSMEGRRSRSLPPPPQLATQKLLLQDIMHRSRSHRSKSREQRRMMRSRSRSQRTSPRRSHIPTSIAEDEEPNDDEGVSRRNLMIPQVSSIDAPAATTTTTTTTSVDYLQASESHTTVQRQTSLVSPTTPKVSAYTAAAILQSPDATLSVTTTASEFDAEEDEALDVVHDLVSEAVSVDDVAWRNALHVLSKDARLVYAPCDGWTVWHVLALADPDVPDFVVHACALTKRGVDTADEQGRLPIHLIAATGASNVLLLQTLVELYPAGLVQTDCQGYTPLHLWLLRQGQADEALTANIGTLRVLLGYSLDTMTNNHSFRGKRLHYGDLHQLDDLQAYASQSPIKTELHPVLKDHPEYPPDVRQALHALWKQVQGDDSPSQKVVDPRQSAASVALPDTLQLPIHLLLLLLDQREEGEGNAVQAKMTKKAKDLVDGSVTDSEQDEEEDDDEAKAGSNPLTLHFFLEAIRLMVAADPQCLCAVDSDNRTPLLYVLQRNDDEESPDVTLVQALLGHAVGQEWAHDLITAQSALPAAQGSPLALHVVAQDYCHDQRLLQTIAEAYPAAVQCTDERGRTPLHVALESHTSLDDATLSWLGATQSRVAKHRDDRGRRPVDIVLRKAPTKWPTTSTDSTSTVYQQFFRESLVGEPMDAMQLGKLARLPPWLRKEVCAVSTVQEWLVDEFLSSPVRCALTLLNGALLVALIVVFRLQIGERVDQLQLDKIWVSSWYTYCVYGIASARLLLMSISWFRALSVKEFRHMILLRPMAWLDAVAMVMTLVTSVFIVGDVVDEELTMILGCASTGLLWISLLYYLSTWWYSMSIFMGAMQSILGRLIGPFVTVCALFMAASQMFYTLLSLDCEDGLRLSELSVCTVQDSYRVVYAFVRGDPLTDEVMTHESIALMALLLFSLAAFLVAFFVTLVMAAMDLDPEQIALESFWEPKLGSIIIAGSDDGDDFDDNTSVYSTVLASDTEGLYSALARTWDTLTMPWRPSLSRKNSQWYSGSVRSTGGTWIYGILAIWLVPCWLLVGLVTFGLLWPPQVRRFIFAPWAKRSTPLAAEQVSVKMSKLEQQVLQLKMMSYDKSNSVEKELKDLKNLLLLAMKED